MHALNRALVILLALVVGLAASAFIALIWEGTSVDWGNSDLRFTASAEGAGTARWVAIGVAAAIAGLMLLLAVLELTPRRRLVELRPGREESVRIAPRDLARSIEEDARRVSHVENAKAKIEAGGKGVAVDLDLYMDRDGEVAAVTEDVQRSIENGLSTRYGLRPARKPHIDVHYVDRPKHAAVRGNGHDGHQEPETTEAPHRREPAETPH